MILLPAGISHFNLDDIQQETEDIDFQTSALNTLPRDDLFLQDVNENGEKKHYRMLLVEGDYEMCKLLKESFSIMYEVIELDDAGEAYAYAIEELPDIIVSEINLPGMSGLEMCSMLKSNVNTSHLPVILLSSYPSEQQNMESIRNGADYYFVMPFNIRILFLRCNYLVKSRKKLLMRKNQNASSEAMEMATNSMEKNFLTLPTKLWKTIGKIRHSIQLFGIRK